MAAIMGKLEVDYMRRRAMVKGQEEEFPCYVIGIGQSGDKDRTYPVCVCEMFDGRILVRPCEDVRFIDTDNGIMI